MKEPILKAKRIVVKLGTQVVMEQDKGYLALDRLFRIVNQCVELMKDGREVLLVTSGAVGLGRKRLNLQGTLDVSSKQACAAVGQSLLMNAYRELFAQHQVPTAQILLSATDFADRSKYLNLQKTLERLLELNVVPIINENDTVSITELQENIQTKSFGDNDKLSAIVAAKLPADLLILLTNVDGLYTDNPATNPDARIISRIDDFGQLSHISTAGQSAYGRGGMSSKVDAARVAAISGVYTIIASGFIPNTIESIFNPKTNTLPGTLVVPQDGDSSRMPERKHWIGLASGYQGVVTVNDGARKALVERHASLLPIGITGVLGNFKAKDVVSLQDESGSELGRGIINFSAEDTRRIQGRPSAEVPKVLSRDADTPEEVIHRDNLVIFEEYNLQ